MKKFIIIFMVVALAITLSFVGCKTTTTETTAAATTAAATTAVATTAAATTEAAAGETKETVEAKKFGLADVPKISNTAPLNLIVETGGVFDKIIPYIEKFTGQTGIKVNVERVASPVVYSKENVELVAGTGVYDLAYVETSWTNEWAQYLFDFRELAAQYDTVEAFNADISNHSPVILACGQAQGKQMVLPFYTYHMSMFVRQDIFDDPTEQAAFKAKYGYDLKAATNFKELRDQGEFFTRKKGDMLKGKPLTQDLYGLAMQAGAYQDNDEFSCYLWGKGADYVKVVKNADGSLKEYVIDQATKDAIKQTMEEYIALTKFGSPGCLTANFDFVVTEQGEGRAVIQNTMFSNCFAWTAGIIKEKVADPDAKIGVYPTLGGKPYTGAWSFGVVKASKNPEGAYWLARYLASFECSEAVMKEGGQLSTRMDVLSDPEWKNAENNYPFGILVDYLLSNWTDQTYVDFIKNAWYFNSTAAGKVYEMQMNVLSKAISGELTVDAMVKELTSQTINLTSKFDKVPIREE